MRGWSSIVAGLGLLALAAGAYVFGGLTGTAMTFGIAGAFLVFHGCRGIGVSDAPDPTALTDFISNPAGSIVEAAAEQAGEWLTVKRKPAAADELPKFDADAALARYMANRPESPPSPPVLEAAPPVRGFGRKGL